MNNVLFLASKSVSRQQLLSLAKIPFIVIDQSADEQRCDWTLPLGQVVEQIALYKMKHALLPTGTHNNQIAYVLTADTLSQTMSEGVIQGKPVDRQDAKKKIRSARNGNNLCTAFCLEKRMWINGEWRVLEHVLQHVAATLRYNVPEELLDYYLDHSLGLSASGAIAVEDFGLQFFQSMQGSYTAIVGLPLFEVRQELTKMGFFD